LEQFWEWIIANKEWLFSGIGAVLVTWIVQFIVKRKQATSAQTIRSGKGSTNIQSGRDTNIGTTEKKADAEEE